MSTVLRIASTCLLLTGLVACTSDPEPTPPAPVTVAPPPPSVAPSGSTPPPDCVTEMVSKMTTQQLAGQALMIGTPVDEPGGLRDEIVNQHLGGLFLAGRSTRPAGALRADIEQLKDRAEIPLLVALDQEGGSVQTLKGRDFPLMGSAERLGAGPPAKLRNDVRDTAKRLAGIGVTVNLAPVADTVPTSVGEANPPIGAFSRQYGSDPGKVADAIEQVVPASQGEGVLTILKHFPGLGRVRHNTDTSTRAVDNTATVNDPYLEPFAAGIKAGSAGVMVSSASYPKLDDENIAAFSQPIIAGLLRDRMGYTGMVMSDDLGAADATEGVRVGDRAVRFVAAGGDLVLSIRPEDARPMANALLAAAERDISFMHRLMDAAKNVLRAKERAGLICG